MKSIFLFLCCIIFLIGCDEDSYINTELKTYLPLQIGNTWTFESTNKNTNDPLYFKRVAAQVNLNNHSYYQIISGSSRPVEVIYDTTYYRIGDEGFVYSMRMNDNKEENVFRLNGQDGDGDTWSYSAENNDEGAISISLLTVDLANKKLRNCKAYYYDIYQWADEEHTVTLAAGIGFVKEYSDAWGNGMILKSATINGHEINF